MGLIKYSKTTGLTAEPNTPLAVFKYHCKGTERYSLREEGEDRAGGTYLEVITMAETPSSCTVALLKTRTFRHLSTMATALCRAGGAKFFMLATSTIQSTRMYLEFKIPLLFFKYSISVPFHFRQLLL